MVNKSLLINDNELVYEIILSKGKGVLTEKAGRMFIKIVKNFMYNFHYYEDESYYDDCQQYALLMLLTNWHKFNPVKYTKALPYFTELAKRGIAHQFNELTYKKKDVRLNIISINDYII